jgi:hypothetical protein
MSAASLAQRPSPLNSIRGLKSLFAHQGAIVASWKTYRGRKLGPYYRLAYRANGRQRSIYLGKSKILLRQVRRLLEKLQKTAKTKRILHQAQKAAQTALKIHMAQFRIDLLRVGLHLRGFAVRGWRRFRALRAPHAPRKGGSFLRRLSVPLRPDLLLYPSPCSSPSNNGNQPPELPVCHPR